MEMPKLTEHHQKLKALVGTWNGEEVMPPSPWNPEASKRTSRTDARLDLGNFFLIMEYVQKSGAQETYRGHGVYGWDPRKQLYTMHWFDVMGGDPGAPALGTWEGNRLSFQNQHHMGHSRYIYEFNGPNAYTFQLDSSQDGKNWMRFVEGKYQRVS